MCTKRLLLGVGDRERQERKTKPNEEVSGRISHRHPVVVRADIPGQNFGQGPRKLWLAGDIHDLKANIHSPKWF